MGTTRGLWAYPCKMDLLTGFERCWPSEAMEGDAHGAPGCGIWCLAVAVCAASVHGDAALAAAVRPAAAAVVLETGL